MVWQALSEYLRATGATPDIEQFEQLFERRLTDKSIRIARGFERNFDQPRTPAEQRIRDLIERHRAARATQEEQEVFRQKRRLADAQRDLTERQKSGKKITKTALEEQRKATNALETALLNISELRRTEPQALDNQIFPKYFTPIVIDRNGQKIVTLARYLLRPRGEPVGYDREHPGLYNVRRDNLEKFRRRQFGRTHALMVVDSFYENVQREGRNVVLHFTPRPPQEMLVACLYSEWGETEAERMLTFAAVTDDPPEEIAAAGHDRCVINLQPTNVDRWLTPASRDAQELHAILGDRQEPYYEHEVEQAA